MAGADTQKLRYSDAVCSVLLKGTAVFLARQALNTGGVVTDVTEKRNHRSGVCTDSGVEISLSAAAAACGICGD